MIVKACRNFDRKYFDYLYGCQHPYAYYCKNGSLY